jgi:hypothetical protein
VFNALSVTKKYTTLRKKTSAKGPDFALSVFQKIFLEKQSGQNEQ